MNRKIVSLIILLITFLLTSYANAADIKAVKVNGVIPTQPDDPFWSERYGPTALKHVIIDMDPQMITNPMWPNPSTKYVFVKAATNGKEIAVHLEYNDATRNDIMVQSQQYKDQAAIMFPVNQTGDEPPFTMGGDGERVNIWQWKATWDKEGAGKDGNNAMQDVEDQYKYMAMGSGSFYMYEPDGKLSGIDTIHGKLRKDENTKDCPIIMLTAKSEDRDKIEGLKLGADDYITKPYNADELTLRIKNLLARSRKYKEKSSLTKIKDLEIDHSKREVKVKGKLVNLTFSEYQILSLFIENPGKAYTKKELNKIIFNTNEEVESRTIDTHVHNLRKKIKSSGDLINTIRSVGFIFKTD